MAFVFRLVIALVMLAAALVHALVPGLTIAGFFSDQVFEMLAGADPLITAYVDAGAWPAVLLGASTLCMLFGAFGVVKGERWAASLVFLTAVADAVSVYLANTMSYTTLPLSLLQIAGLGASLVVLFLIVRAITKPV